MSSYSDLGNSLKAYRETGRLGPEGVSKRSLSESKKKSKEVDNAAKFHICMCIQLCSKGLYRVVGQLMGRYKLLKE